MNGWAIYRNGREEVLKGHCTAYEAWVVLREGDSNLDP